jgi:hypothetical protein
MDSVTSSTNPAHTNELRKRAQGSVFYFIWQGQLRIVIISLDPRNSKLWRGFRIRRKSANMERRSDYCGPTTAGSTIGC